MRGVLRGVLLGSCVLGALACGGSSEPVGTGNDDDDSSGNGGNGSGGSGNAGGTGGGECDPEATEACNGFDDDCDGDVDEPPCTCAEGATQPCYTGRPPRTAGIGECVEGTQACGPGGVWGACTGSVGPAPEECNGADDDCNDAIDDLGDETCGVGACQVTVAMCDGGSPNTCTPNMPTIEICDGIDNDCDQLTDETFPTAGMVCDTQMPGACAAGTLQCLMSAEVCVPNATAVNETCNNIDDDCNGTVDDNVPGTGGACDTGFPGICGPGTVSCQQGVTDCFSNVPPSGELCDSIDNDCDGVVDQGNPEGGAFCNTGLQGICQAGTETCQNGQIACLQNLQPTTECLDQLDNDCDGLVDDGAVGAETFEMGLNGWTLQAGWSIAAWAGNPGNGLGYGNGTSFPTSNGAKTASKNLVIPQGATTMTLQYRYGSGDCCNYDQFAISLGGQQLLYTDAGDGPTAGWVTLTYNIPANMQGTTQNFVASFNTIDGVAQTGWGASIDNITIPCN